MNLAPELRNDERYPQNTDHSSAICSPSDNFFKCLLSVTKGSITKKMERCNVITLGESRIPLRFFFLPENVNFEPIIRGLKSVIFD